MVTNAKLMNKPKRNGSADEAHSVKDNVEKRSSSTRIRHATLNDVIVVQTYEPDFQLAVEQARAASHPIEIKLEGYGNKEVAIACLWYALDQGWNSVV